MFWSPEIYVKKIDSLEKETCGAVTQWVVRVESEPRVPEFRNLKITHPKVFYKKMFFKISQNSLENTVPESLFQQSLKKETRTQVFFCEFFEIFKNIYFCRTFLVAVSVSLILLPSVVRSLRFARIWNARH